MKVKKHATYIDNDQVNVEVRHDNASYFFKSLPFLFNKERPTFRCQSLIIQGIRAYVVKIKRHTGLFCYEGETTFKITFEGAMKFLTPKKMKVIPQI